MKRFKCFMAVMLAICLCIAHSTVAEAASKTITVSTQAQLEKEIKAGKASTIKLATKKNVKITIPAGSKAKKMKLIVDAPKATITNKATFKSITLSGNGVKSYTENGEDNAISVTAKTAKVTVAKSAIVEKLTIKSTTANVTVNNGGEISQLLCSKKNGTVNMKVNGSISEATINAEGVKLNASGNASGVSMVVTTKNVKVTASLPVWMDLNVTAEIVLKKGAENSRVSTVTDAKITNGSKEKISVWITDCGEVYVESGEKKNSVRISANNILDFRVDRSTPMILEDTITLTVAYGTDLTNIVPKIDISEGATISPESSVAQDFTKPVAYTVTAKDGTKKKYMVTTKWAVNEGPSFSVRVTADDGKTYTQETVYVPTSDDRMYSLDVTPDSPMAKAGFTALKDFSKVTAIIELDEWEADEEYTYTAIVGYNSEVEIVNGKCEMEIDLSKEDGTYISIAESSGGNGSAISYLLKVTIFGKSGN